MCTIFRRISIALLLVLSFAVCNGDNEFEEPRVERFSLSVLLATVPYPGHATPFLALGQELVRRGHNVTLVTAPSDFIQREVERSKINLWSIGKGFASNNYVIEQTQQLVMKNISTSASVYNSFKLSTDYQRRTIKTIDNAAITSFDIIVGDSSFFTSLVCFSHKWNITSVNVLVSLPINQFELQAWPFPVPLLGYTDNLTFLQRLISTTIKMFIQCFALMATSIIPFFNRSGICKRADMPSTAFLLNSHHIPQIIMTSFGFDFPRATLPLTDYVGPFLSQSQPQLPQHIAEWLAPKGPRSVVYVSMGSAVILTSEQAQMLISGATQANLSVVWSLRKSNQHILQHMTYDSDSVLIVEWAPQVTVLKHPSIHSAILHGGLGGVQEALSCGVPMIVLPFVTDQFDNALHVQHYHYGEMITLPELTTPLVTKTLRRINSMQYRESLWKIQQIYKKDGGVSRAADLVEFYSDVGYDHLVPSYIKYNWNWIEYHNVDVYAVLILSVLLPSYLLYRILRSCPKTK